MPAIAPKPPGNGVFLPPRPVLDRGMRIPTPLAVLLGLVLLAPAAGADPVLDCNGPAGGHLGAATVCAQLAARLAGRDVILRLELTRDEPLALAGRLVWLAGGRQVSGPLVDVTAQDRPLDARAADRLVRGLLAVSDLP